MPYKYERLKYLFNLHDIVNDEFTARFILELVNLKEGIFIAYASSDCIL